MTVFQNAFLDSVLVLRTPTACPAFAGLAGPLSEWRWGLGAAAAAGAGRGRPGCLRGPGEQLGPLREGSLSSATRGNAQLSCGLHTNPLRDYVSSGYHSGSRSAAEAFHWEMQHQKSMLLDSKWLWNSCTGAAK